MISLSRLRASSLYRSRALHPLPVHRSLATSALLVRSPGRPVSTTSRSLVQGRGYGAVQIRQMGFLSAAARAAGRMGGKMIGLGAVGAGGAAYVGSQVDGVVTTFQNAYSQAFEEIGTLATAAGKSLESFGKATSDTFSFASESVADRWFATKTRMGGLWSNLQEGMSWGSEREAGTGGGAEGRGPEGSGAGARAAGAAAAAQLPVFMDIGEEDPRPPTVDSTAGLMHLTKKLIGIRTLLMSIDHDESLVLPSIVVIGSQSSGKSSVLEAIVGHEFLPKGNNMVTRRPLELTLVHTSPTVTDPIPIDYAECPQFGPGRFEDFSEIQRRLTRLNLDVPDSVAVDDSPIYLRIHSANVPDLSLVDLPGYVQISSMDQPEELREKISGLCDKYIRKPNIILSVCAADVDLANSPALRASRKVDPHGYRTIGVITKMDLVDPEVGASILSNEKYRLALGYVGVIGKATNSYSPTGSEHRLLPRRFAAPASVGVAEVARQEAAFFKAHREEYDQPGMLVGISTLKQRLIKVLEDSMASSLHDISNRVSLELEEATYQYKVLYNDRPISVETYVAETMDSVKTRVSEMHRALTKPEVRGLLKQELDQKVQELLAEVYWSDRRGAELGKLGDSKVRPEELEPYWTQRLDAAQSRLTKSGIGRSTTELVSDELRAALGKLVTREPLHYHPDAVERILDVSDDILDDLLVRAADHVEIAVMPYRYDIELDKPEWEKGRTRAAELMAKEIELCDGFVKGEKAELRRNWRFREAVEYVREVDERMRRQAQRRLQASEGGVLPEEVEEDTRPPPLLLDRARQLRDLEQQLQTLKLRQMAIKSRRCKTGPENKAFCPEVFLNAVADRLAHTATDFINIDLLSRYFSALPHELNSRIVKQLDGEDGLVFARQNPEVRRHLELQDRKNKLEAVMRELATLAHMQEDGSSTSRHTRRRRGYFSGLF